MREKDSKANTPASVAVANENFTIRQANTFVEKELFHKETSPWASNASHGNAGALGKNSSSNHLLQLILSIRQSLYVAIFVKKLKMLSRRFIFRHMERRSFDVISDSASHYDYYVNKGLIQPKHKATNLFAIIRSRMQWRRLYCFQFLWKAEKMLYSCLRPILFTISPRNKIKIMWDSFIYLLLVVNIFYVPVQLAWEEWRFKLSSDYNLMSVLLGDVPGWAFLLDIVLTFFTGYYDEGRLVTKRRLIAKHYLRKQFWADIIVTLPFLINQYANVRFLNVILLLRIKNMLKRQASFEELVDFSPNQQLVYDICQIVATIVFMAHFVGCFYFMLGQIEDNIGMTTTWITFYDVSGSFSSQYVTSLYWATITMVTIGYGDISPQTQYERIFVLFVALIGCCYFAAIISSIGGIVQAWQQRFQEKRKRMSILIQYLKQRGVSKQLQFKVKKQIAYAYERDEEYSNEAVEILESLSSNLQKDVMMFIHKSPSLDSVGRYPARITKYSNSMFVMEGRIETDILSRVLRSIKFISNRYSDQFLEQLITILKPRSSEPGEVVLEDDSISESIFCVLNGQLRFELDVISTANNSSKQVMSVYNKLDTFGDYCFLSGKTHKGRVVSVTTSSMMVLEKHSFEELIRMYPKDYELYRMQVDQVQVDSSFKYSSRHCSVCASNSHFFFDCPVSTCKLYLPKVISDKDPIMPQEQLLQQDRKDPKNKKQKCPQHFQRAFAYKQSTFALLEPAQKCAIQYILNNDLVENVKSINALIGGSHQKYKSTNQSAASQPSNVISKTQRAVSSLTEVSSYSNSDATFLPTGLSVQNNHSNDQISQKKKLLLKSRTFNANQKHSRLSQRSSIDNNNQARESKTFSTNEKEEKMKILSILKEQVEACQAKLGRAKREQSPEFIQQNSTSVLPTNRMNSEETTENNSSPQLAQYQQQQSQVNSEQLQQQQLTVLEEEYEFSSDDYNDDDDGGPLNGSSAAAAAGRMLQSQGERDSLVDESKDYHGFSSVNDFERKKEFKIYFPHGNFRVISSMKNSQKFFLARVQLKANELSKKLEILRSVNMSNSHFSASGNHALPITSSQISRDPFNKINYNRMQEIQENSKNYSLDSNRQMIELDFNPFAEDDDDDDQNQDEQEQNNGVNNQAIPTFPTHQNQEQQQQHNPKQGEFTRNSLHPRNSRVITFDPKSQ